MKGITKAFQRTPHMLTSRVGMAKKSSDPVTDNLILRFTAVEDHIGKLTKDTTAFRDAVNSLLSSSTDFAHAFTTIFSPIGGESPYEFEGKFPSAKLTIQHIGEYDASFDELKETIRPEIELIESRILAPVKELNEFAKRVRKHITKRDHKLVDFDRHNNTYTKLRDKKDKSLNEEKNIFRVEQDFEAASAEYEHYNTLLQTELPRFFEYATAFVTPLFHSFYYMQLNVFYMMLEKLNAFTQHAGYSVQSAGDVETIFAQKQGDAPTRLNDLSITKRGMSTAQILSQSRISNAAGAAGASPGLRSKAPSISSSHSGGSRFTAPPVHGGGAAAPPSYQAAAHDTRPALTSTPSASGKRAPPPPPALKARPSTGPKPIVATALYDFQAQNDGDLSFQTGDRITIIEKSDSMEDWWMGMLNGQRGTLPANYLKLD